MTVPRFQSDQLNRKLAAGDIGEAFQRFVHELLAIDFPGLHLFPTGGKDGGIDLSKSGDGLNIFVECKYIGADGLRAAQRRWREVAKRLGNHLVDASHPSVGQRQYAPWYGKENPVSEYLFCISSILANQDQLEQLRDEIQDFFRELSMRHKHLSHLASVSVRVLDWNDLRSHLTRFPHILLRWFPRTRPVGLLPIDDFVDSGSFRSYLSGDTLPYYSRHRHLLTVPPPPELTIADEEELLLELAEGDLAGLIITGIGGVGKTRLTLEIGRLARQKGWLALRSRGNLTADSVIQLAEIVNREHRVLIIADYVEVQREFNEFVETLIALNETYDLRIRY